MKKGTSPDDKKNATNEEDKKGFKMLWMTVPNENKETLFCQFEYDKWAEQNKSMLKKKICRRTHSQEEYICIHTA